MRNNHLKAIMLASIIPLASLPLTQQAIADETCLSPYTISLIKGQEKYLQVWTLGVKGVGDESDKLVTIDVDPASKTYGKVVNYLSVGGRGEAHHMGFTDDRKYVWAGRLDDNKIFVFDVGTDPSKPKLVNTIVDFDKRTGFVGPHTFYALPGRVLVGALSNSKDHGGETGMAVYSRARRALLLALKRFIDCGAYGVISFRRRQNAFASGERHAGLEARLLWQCDCFDKAEFLQMAYERCHAVKTQAPRMEAWGHKVRS
jgi:56kDa selenium binding protein (SBP56)